MDEDNTLPAAALDAGDLQVQEDFSDLLAEANALEGGPPVPGSPEAQATDAQSFALQVEGNTELIEFGWQIAAPWLPERYAVQYGQQQRAKIAEAYTRLAIKRGWDMGDLFEKWGPEIAFVAAIAAPALPVFMADVKRRKEGGTHVGDGKAPD